MEKIISLLVLVFVILSCGNNGNKRTGDDIIIADTTIQTVIYGLTLGNKYSESELVDTLRQVIKDLTTQNDHFRGIWISNRPYLSMSEENNYKSYWIANNEFQRYLFGNLYWDTFRLETTNDNRLYRIGFTSSTVDKEQFDAYFKSLFTVLKTKYCEPNHLDFGDYGQEVWYDGKTQLDLDWEKGTTNYYMTIEYMDVDIHSEIGRLQKSVGNSQL